MTDLQFIASSECQKGAEIVSSKQRQHQQQLKPRTLRQNESISENDRAQEKIVQQVVHVIAPANQTGVAILTDLAVIVVSHPLQKDHQRHQPQPANICCRQETEQQD